MECKNQMNKAHLKKYKNGRILIIHMPNLNKENIIYRKLLLIHLTIYILLVSVHKIKSFLLDNIT
jgi:hypothetical protein